ncbi:hypothetical protein SAMN05428949_0531 [Chitinophaga sp. YR627]|nr:hypothetical protein SAMN05428949_0531 [Chitinophaga sp. YR627]
MHTSIIPVKSHTRPADKFTDVHIAIVAYMSAMLLATMTFPLRKSLLLLMLDKLYAVLIEHRY